MVRSILLYSLYLGGVLYYSDTQDIRIDVGNIGKILINRVSKLAFTSEIFLTIIIFKYLALSISV